jgi:hypothetical protein
VCVYELCVCLLLQELPALCGFLDLNLNPKPKCVCLLLQYCDNTCSRGGVESVCLLLRVLRERRTEDRDQTMSNTHIQYSGPALWAHTRALDADTRRVRF